jgi:maleylacetoacetate isomerase
MAQPMELFTYYRSTSSYRVRIALALKGLDYTATPVNLRGSEYLKPDYQAINPQCRVPVLRIDHGFIITQSTAIIEYLEDRYPESPLLSSNLELRALQRAVASLIASDIHPLHNVSVLNRLRALGHGEDEVKQWIGHWISEGFAAVEQMIGEQGYCFDKEVPSMADVYLLPQVYAARRFNVNLNPYPRILRVEQRALNHWAFQAAHPDAQADKPE